MQRILLVEDNPSDAKIMTFLLEKMGYSVSWAMDVYKTLDILQKYPIDVVLLDWMLPHVNGIDILKTIRHDPLNKEVPVIFTTSRSEPRDITRAANAGVTDYLIKPIDPITLETKIKKALTRSIKANLLTIPPSEARKAEIRTDVEVVGISESHLQLLSHRDYEKGEIIFLHHNLLFQLGMKDQYIQIDGSLKQDNHYLIDASFTKMDSEDLQKLKIYLYTLNQGVSKTA